MQTSVVDAARQALGPVGVCLPVSFTRTPPADLQREAVSRLERGQQPNDTLAEKYRQWLSAA